jgi:isopentenyl-diphosphate delta-isomerase
LDRVILVDEEDREIGTEEKIAAHLGGGRLHRAISIFLFNSRSELLVQQRAATKYHFAGLWSNTCCSHPRPGESIADVSERRLREEMGISAPLKAVRKFIYKATDLTTSLSEHELVHLVVGHTDVDPRPDASEVGDWAWMGLDQLRKNLEKTPSAYTPWFPIGLSLLEPADCDAGHGPGSRGPFVI